MQTVNQFVLTSIIIGALLMPTVDFEGQSHNFPDDFSDEDISMALSSQGSNEPQEVVDSEEAFNAEADTMGLVASGKAHTVGFDDAVAYAIENEGGDALTNDPDDKGGQTKFGISKQSYPDEDIAAMTEDRAKEIYRRDFWDKPRLGKLPDRLATKMFDAGVNVGSKRGVMLLQRQLGVIVTGTINDATVAAIERRGEETVISGYVKTLKEYYSKVAKRGNNKKFLKGWNARADRLPEVIEDEEESNEEA